MHILQIQDNAQGSGYHPDGALHFTDSDEATQWLRIQYISQQTLLTNTECIFN